MKVNFFDVKRQYDLIKDEINNRIIEIVESGAYVNGPAVKDLERDLAKYLNAKHVITVGNGTDALEIALKSIDIKPGDEVITTPFSFFATSEAIAIVGATPVFVDIDESNLTIDVKRIEEKITSKTKAILPVHIFGAAANMDEIMQLAKKYKLHVIEDAAQAIGTKYHGKMAGVLGDIACFSFYPTKNLGCYGDGGMIVTNDDKLASIVKALKVHGAGKDGCLARELLTGIKEEINNNEQVSDLYDPYKYYNYLIGYNSRLDSIQAGILDIKLKHLEEYNNRRREIAKKYNQGLMHINEISIPLYNEENSYHQFVILTSQKEALIKYMNDNGVGCANFYPVPLHLQKAFDYLNYHEGDLKIAEKICKQTVCLPIFPELTEKEINYVIEKVKEFFEV